MHLNVTGVSEARPRVLIWRMMEAKGQKDPEGSALFAWEENEACVSEQNSEWALKITLALFPQSWVS